MDAPQHYFGSFKITTKPGSKELPCFVVSLVIELSGLTVSYELRDQLERYEGVEEKMLPKRAAETVAADYLLAKYEESFETLDILELAEQDEPEAIIAHVPPTTVCSNGAKVWFLASEAADL